MQPSSTSWWDAERQQEPTSSSGPTTSWSTSMNTTTPSPWKTSCPWLSRREGWSEPSPTNLQNYLQTCTSSSENNEYFRRMIHANTGVTEYLLKLLFFFQTERLKGHIIIQILKYSSHLLYTYCRHTKLPYQIQTNWFRTTMHTFHFGRTRPP